MLLVVILVSRETYDFVSICLNTCVFGSQVCNFFMGFLNGFDEGELN